ncbi:cell division protein FtsQ/DivIB [Nitrincola sp. A-D6]|uniref:cell division protein FtsQ/DivIB n=1 Tax=Nitrincola sp. A-D6 TaxID=1545442 RepID=UPI0011857894|nr:FtsQ-type POTRA domain-containing protein [Nitrincola sp. A-D6]
MLSWWSKYCALQNETGRAEDEFVVAWLKQESQPVAPVRGAVAVQRPSETPVEPMPVKRAALLLGLLSLFVLLVMGLADKALAWLDKPVNEVSISGQMRYLDGQALASHLAQEVKAPILSLDLRSLRDVTLANPWVHTAEVRRQWPAAVHVSVAEQVPVARWEIVDC